MSVMLSILKQLFVSLTIISFVYANDSSNNQVKHTNNWAVIVDTSRFWFNYRHAANALSIYRSVKRLGIPDR
jgi:phosphatidylinositol glycan class K